MSGSFLSELRLCFAATAVFCVTSASGYADGFTFQTLNDQVDPTFNQLLGINNAGTIAGYFGIGSAAHPNKGYTVVPPYSQASYTNENFPGSVQTQVTAINGPGNTAGFWVDAKGANHGFVDIGNVFSTVDNPLTTATPAFNQLLSLNDHNVTAGFYNDAANNSHGYTFDIGTGKFMPVNPPGATSALATGINNAGEVSGFYTAPSGNVFGFLLNGSTFTSFEAPGSTNTTFLGLNNRGQVVGTFVDAGGVMHGVVYDSIANTWTTVDDPNGMGTTTINGINDLGQLVGFFVDGNGNTDGLLATPTPEPVSLALVGLGALALGAGLKMKTRRQERR